MTIQELYDAQEKIGALAAGVPEEGFDWGDDRPAIKEIVRLLCGIATTCHLNVDWVRVSLIAIARRYGWNPPDDNPWLLDACAQVGWWEFVEGNN